MNRVVALFIASQVIVQANIAECAAHHHLVVAASRSVGVEIAPLHALRDQVATGGTVGGETARGGDVIGRDRIVQQRQHARAVDIRLRPNMASTSRITPPWRTSRSMC